MAKEPSSPSSSGLHIDADADLLREMLESAPDALIAVDASGAIVIANRQAEELFGYDRQELLGKQIELLVPEALRSNHVEQRRSYTRRPAMRPMGTGLDLQARRKDGSGVAVEISLSPLQTDNGLLVLSCVRDVTYRRQVEQALRESEQRFRAIFDQEYQFVGLLTVDGVVLEANQTSLDAVDVGLADVVGVPFWQTPWWAWSETESTKLERAISKASTGELVRFEAMHPARDGSYICVDFSIKPVRDEAGEIVFLLPEGRDITAMKRAQEELAARNADLDDFAHIASHDLREPLRGISNYATFLAEDHAEGLDREGRRMLEAIRTLSDRAESLVDGLLEYSLVGRVEITATETDLNEVLREILDSLQFTVEESSVDVRVPRPLPAIHCDRVRVGELLRNLITNAVKYNDSPQKWVEIGWRDDAGDVAVFYVRDNGIGIPDKHHDDVFDMFRRLHQREEFGGGTGAGLSIARKIVERHGGRIWVESAETQGTTFCFTLPGA